MPIFGKGGGTEEGGYETRRRELPRVARRSKLVTRLQQLRRLTQIGNIFLSWDIGQIKWVELFRESGWHTVHATGGSLGHSTIFFNIKSILVKVFSLIWAKKAVDETSGSSHYSISYQVPGVLQETGWDIFTIRTEEGSSMNGIDFGTYAWYCQHFFFCCSIILCLYHLLCRVSAQHFPWNSGGVMICIFLIFILSVLLLSLIPSCWHMCVVPVVSSSVCVLH